MLVRKQKVLKIVPLLTVSYILFLAVTVSNNVAKAAKLTDGVWSQAGDPGATTITFTSTSSLDDDSEIVITFPSTATVSQVGTNISVTGQTTPVRTNNTVDNTITIQLDGTFSESLAVTIVMNDALTAYTTSTYAQESLAVNTQDSGGNPVDFGLAIITNDNTTLITASVPLFVNMAIDDTTIELGTLSMASIASATQQYTVNSNNQSGVTMQIATDGDLDDGLTNTIDAVIDSAVTAGEEEYGIAVVGAGGLDIDATYNTGDNAIVEAADDLASSDSAIDGATVDITYKASISGTTVSGIYNQVVTVTVATIA